MGLSAVWRLAAAVSLAASFGPAGTQASTGLQIIDVHAMHASHRVGDTMPVSVPVGNGVHEEGDRLAGLDHNNINVTGVSAAGFQINAGLNDAWFNPATDGQGFLIAVYPMLQKLFLGWFTYDVERPPQSVTALLGDPGHRWLTATGDYSGDTATLEIDLAQGGVFNAAAPAPTHQTYGTITIEFLDCGHAELNYDITSVGLSGTIPLWRIVDDNVALCEDLNGQ
jgi:hypothetical protein